MKTSIKILIIIFIVSMVGEAQSNYPYRTIRSLQYNHIDSLILADALQNTVPSRWTLQSCNFLGDTVKIVGVCIIPPKVLNYTTFGYNMVLADTGYSGPFGYIFIRPPISSTVNPGDTVFYQNILNIQEGDVVEVVGRVWDFPGPGESGYPTMNSMSQIIPLRDPNFNIIGDQNIPPIVPMQTSDFYTGIFPGGQIKYSTGEPYESGYVELTNLTVVSWLHTGNGTVNLLDDFGNMISTYDGSKWWTLRGHRAPNTTYTAIFPINTRIDTIRGWITTVSGTENPRGYRISPVYPNDVVIGVARPSITTVRRYPVIVQPDTLPRIEAIFRKGAGGNSIASRLLFYSVNDSPFIIDTMRAISGDTLYRSIIPAFPDGSFIKYFLKATDSLGYSTISASGAGSGLGSDTSRGFYFYKVTSGNLSIRDIQYTPFTNGRSPYVGAVTTVRGIVTADTNDIGLSARTSGGTTVWYMQNGNDPSSGIWFVGTIGGLRGLQKGDSISITGTIQEQFDVTRIGDVSSVSTITTGNILPSPIKRSTGHFGPGVGNGNLIAESWEGMLVEFDTVTVTNLWPTFADPSEYSISDGSGDIIVRRDGMNSYSNVPGDTIYPGTQIIKVGDRFSKFRGIIFYSFNRYKICPRRDADFGTYLPLSVNDNISNTIPEHYFLANNYPNPFNPNTVIEYSIPTEEMVTLKVYNIIGQEVASLKNEVQKAGTYRVHFDGSSAKGGLASGIYFYRLQAGNFNQVKKMMLIR